jgi:2-amino-4-hydroxy-6-hydroxymethyldihydropteridine diphosphokinase
VVWVTLGLGSNSKPHDNLHSALDALLLKFRDMKLSSVFESEAADEKGSSAYLNMAVAFETAMPLQQIRVFLKQLEDKHGRNQTDSTTGRIPLDIDILTYGDLVGNFDGLQLPRPQILDLAYVLWPLSQVGGQLKHPVARTSFATLWKSFAGKRLGMRPVHFEWHGRLLSTAG